MSDGERLDLTRPRAVGELLSDAFVVYARNFPVLFLIAAAVVIPVQLVVSGIGLEELTSPYRDDAKRAELLIPTLVSFLVVAPLIAATTIHTLKDLAAGQAPHAGRALQAGLDVFAPVFLAVLLAGIGIALGLFLLILPGIYVAVRWFFVPQAVVIDGARGGDALRRSWELVQGFWWRTLGVALLANLVAVIPGIMIVGPLDALAKSADQQAISLAGSILAETLTAPFVALVSTLLFFDLRARRSANTSGAVIE